MERAKRKLNYSERPNGCFNGAMTFQSWKDGIEHRVAQIIFGKGFNGAMTFQSWKVLLGQSSGRRGSLASMGP